MINIANPIYDNVFKYLVEDERVTKTLLSALLKKKVVEVEMGRNEYSSQRKDPLSIFRIDFCAKVEDEDGKLNTILIELQKTWVETETLRFRQYLGAQYAAPSNIDNDFEEEVTYNGRTYIRKGYGIPIVTIYLLGHRVGNLPKPVVYVRRGYFDDEDQPITMGVPDPFIESLTHDSIVVQIPLLKHHVKSSWLYEVLDCFDQSRVIDSQSKQILGLDEKTYESCPPEIHRIYERLLSAAADSEMRMKMNVEEEVLSAMEDNDTMKMQIKNLKADNKQKDEQLQQRDEQLQQRDEQLQQRDEQLQQRDEQLRNAIKMFAASGIPIEVMARNFNVSEDFIKECLTK